MTHFPPFGQVFSGNRRFQPKFKFLVLSDKVLDSIYTLEKGSCFGASRDKSHVIFSLGSTDVF